ncbi:hypothetical protein ACSV5M_14495 [Cellvibrio sp. ARAG 10.3]|uniref:hypothetical protein n=1 Tax=Cellvibrio sp. ARAG 10.3 TaxID=3451358 RepID=UPI003F46A88E
MTKLVIGKDAIEVKAAKKKVLSNLRMLNSRIQGLCRSSASFDILYTFYNAKVEEQLSILAWFDKFDQASSVTDLSTWTSRASSEIQEVHPPHGNNFQFL